MTYDDVGYRLRRIQGLLEEILEVLTPVTGCNCHRYRIENQWLCPVHGLQPSTTTKASDKICYDAL